jgi:hypothetical protein
MTYLKKRRLRLGVLAALVAQAPGKLGRTALMKMAYFLQTIKGVSLGYDFRMYTYGPFDQDVLDDLSTARGLGRGQIPNRFFRLWSRLRLRVFASSGGRFDEEEVGAFPRGSCFCHYLGAAGVRPHVGRRPGTGRDAGFRGPGSGSGAQANVEARTSAQSQGHQAAVCRPVH